MDIVGGLQGPAGSGGEVADAGRPQMDGQIFSDDVCDEGAEVSESSGDKVNESAAGFDQGYSRMAPCGTIFWSGATLAEVGPLLVEYLRRIL